MRGRVVLLLSQPRPPRRAEGRPHKGGGRRCSSSGVHIVRAGGYEWYGGYCTTVLSMETRDEIDAETVVSMVRRGWRTVWILQCSATTVYTIIVLSIHTVLY